MKSLKKKLMTDKHLAESTSDAYIRTLYTLNGRQNFKNLNFLKKTAEIESLLSNYADSTRKSMLASIVSVLAMAGQGFKKAHDSYSVPMMTLSKESKEFDSKNEKTAKQKDNWISWEDIQKKHQDLIGKVSPYVNKRSLTASEWNTLQQLLVLSLYTMIPPRRNQDYLLMDVGAKPESPDRNLYEKAKQDFIFRKFKTAKTFGEQKENVPENLQSVLDAYLTFHPLRKESTFPLLVTSDGRPITSGNAITRILNSVLGGKVGASMLRHIYLSHKFGDTLADMKSTAQKMGHSLSESHVYTKQDSDSDSETSDSD